VSMDIVNWLLDSDPAIQYQVHRDLLHKKRPDIQKRISKEGWGQAILNHRHPEGHWGLGFYQPKWTSSHYSILLLYRFGMEQDHPLMQESVLKIAHENTSVDGGINPHREIANSDVCINGMFMAYGSYFKLPEEHFHSVVDFVLGSLMGDGGFNCRFNRSGAKHSSLHTTISMLEGIHEYELQGYSYKLEELKQAEKSSQEFLLQHRLYKSDKTGEIIHPSFTRFAFPPRWKYDVLRALDYFQWVQHPYDERLADALELLKHKQTKDGIWKATAKHPGKVYVDLEPAGKPGRWNTLRALRVLKHFE
jgi:hypothetical protein